MRSACEGLQWSGRLRLLVAAVVGLTLAACGNETELKWQEDVKLQDGRVITVTRRSEFKASHEIGQAPGESWMSMDFEHPSTREKVHFESKLRGSTGDMEAARAKAATDPSLMNRPYALMMKGRDLYVVAWLDSNIDDFFGCPDPPFFLYQWQQGHWERRPLEEIPYRRFSPNVTIDAGLERQKIKGSGHHLRAEQIVFTDAGYGPVEFDFTGMSRQAFDLPPNCSSCTQRGPYGPRADSPVTAPTCLRAQRDWKTRNHLTN